MEDFRVRFALAVKLLQNAEPLLEVFFHLLEHLVARLNQALEDLLHQGCIQPASVEVTVAD